MASCESHRVVSSSRTQPRSVGAVPSTSEVPPVSTRLARGHNKSNPSQLWESTFVEPWVSRVYTSTAYEERIAARKAGLRWDADHRRWYLQLSNPDLLVLLRKYGLCPPTTRTVIELKESSVRLNLGMSPSLSVSRGVGFYIDLLSSVPYSLYVPDACRDPVYELHLRTLYRTLDHLVNTNRRLSLRAREYRDCSTWEATAEFPAPTSAPAVDLAPVPDEPRPVDPRPSATAYVNRGTVHDSFHERHKPYGLDSLLLEQEQLRDLLQEATRRAEHSRLRLGTLTGATVAETVPDPDLFPAVPTLTDMEGMPPLEEVFGGGDSA